MGRRRIGRGLLPQAPHGTDAASLGARAVRCAVAIELANARLFANRSDNHSCRDEPLAAVVNPVTNKIYVVNDSNPGTVTVIDGATNTPAPTPVAAGTKPFSVAVNPVTNQIYVANQGDGISPSTVTVIDGATNLTTTVPAGTKPFSVAVNPVTNKIYVANQGDNTVTVINGANNDVVPPVAATVAATVPVGTKPFSVAVNPVTNKIYVANQGDGINPSTVTVIDGDTNTAITTVATGILPEGVAVNAADEQDLHKQFRQRQRDGD